MGDVRARALRDLQRLQLELAGGDGYARLAVTPLVVSVAEEAVAAVRAWVDAGEQALVDEAVSVVRDILERVGHMLASRAAEAPAEEEGNVFEAMIARASDTVVIDLLDEAHELYAPLLGSSDPAPKPSLRGALEPQGPPDTVEGDLLAAPEVVVVQDEAMATQGVGEPAAGGDDLGPGEGPIPPLLSLSAPLAWSEIDLGLAPGVAPGATKAGARATSPPLSFRLRSSLKVDSSSETTPPPPPPGTMPCVEVATRNSTVNRVSQGRTSLKFASPELGECEIPCHELTVESIVHSTSLGTIMRAKWDGKVVAVKVVHADSFAAAPLPSKPQRHRVRGEQVRPRASKATRKAAARRTAIRPAPRTVAGGEAQERSVGAAESASAARTGQGGGLGDPSRVCIVVDF